jgi:hypothetical protein
MQSQAVGWEHLVGGAVRPGHRLIERLNRRMPAPEPARGKERERPPVAQPRQAAEQAPCLPPGTRALFPTPHTGRAAGQGPSRGPWQGTDGQVPLHTQAWWPSR